MAIFLHFLAVANKWRFLLLSKDLLYIVYIVVKILFECVASEQTTYNFNIVKMKYFRSMTGSEEAASSVSFLGWISEGHCDLKSTIVWFLLQSL